MTTNQTTKPVTPVLSDSRTVAASVRHLLHGLDHEEAWITYLTKALTVIDTEMISKGTLCRTSLDCRTVLRNALLKNAAGVILFHNHPSGDPRPSRDDIQFTSSLKKACSLMDILLLDHIILTDNSFFSFHDEMTHNI